MALIEKLKDTVTGAAHVARSAGHQVQSTARPAALEAARLIRSRLRQRRTAPPPDRTPEPPAQAAPIVADGPRPPSEPAETPTPAAVAKNIAPHPQPAATRKTAAAKRSAPGAKLPVKRPPTKPDRGER